ncbi:MAG TPA: sigma-54 dependent transcriptional regulator [Pelobium sp.]|nr:sigma-54 dependent transcriptional regulator [Pelobium sp.]
MPPKILIIDDEEKLRNLLGRIVKLEGYEVREAADAKEGLQILTRENINVVLCDVKLPDANGVNLAEKIKLDYPQIEIILLTAYGNIPDGVQAIKNGAFDYITKGDDNKKILPLLAKACEKSQTNSVLNTDKHKIDVGTFEQILGESKEIKQAIELAKKVAPTNTSVFLSGETGTGKEIFANAIHNASERKKQNFIAINCAAFSKELLESELFGHKAGAFTGAQKDKKGLFEEANNGTIFLDEVGELHLDLQAKLLRILESGELIKIGDSKITKVDVRIISATNRDLQQEVKNGNFREDIFYRLSVFTIHLPPLRERNEDILVLAIHFLSLFAEKAKKQIKGFDSQTIQALQNHSWKGNIRELKNTVERAVILTDSNLVTMDALPPNFNLGDHKELSDFELASAEKKHIEKVLHYTKNNKTETARLLNIALTTLYRKLEEYRLR